MGREELESAAETLEAAAELATDEEVRSGLTTHAEAYRTLATRERGPDHGRLARHERGLADLRADASEDVAERIERALADVRAYRETVDGV